MIFINFISLFKMTKRGYFPQEPRADVTRDPHGWDLACKATWQSHASPHGRLGGANEARTRGKATRVHADAWVAPRGMNSDRLSFYGPTG